MAQAKANNQGYDVLYKIIITGPAECGKSNILLRFTQNKFNLSYNSTIGVEFGTKLI